jgi:ribosomal protein L37E
MLIICASCGRRRTLEHKPKGTLRCSVCGAGAARIVRKIKAWMAYDDYDGAGLERAREDTMAGLVWYAHQRGYKPGWAAVKFKAIYGCWPNGESQAKPEPPQVELMRWIGRQNLRYAAEMRKQERITARNES